jgi:hypothetical protein
MSVPSWYVLLLLSAAAYRSWRLLAEDDVLDRPRRWLVRLGPEWKQEGDPVPATYRARLGKFLSCPWCFGAWVAIGWWVAWQLWPHGTTVVAVPFAASAVVAGLSSLLDKER